MQKRQRIKGTEYRKLLKSEIVIHAQTQSMVSTHSLCEGVVRGRRIQAPRTVENCKYDIRSSTSVCLCVSTSVLEPSYLQQESLVFNNGVLGSKVFVAGKLHRNNGPELRQREDTHTHTYTFLEVHYTEECFRSSSSIHPSITLTVTPS